MSANNDRSDSLRGWILILLVSFSVVSLLIAGLRDQRAYEERIIQPAELHRLIRDCYALQRHTEIIRDARMNVVDFNCIAYKPE